MRDHLRTVSFFGRDYYWHREPGRPLELLHAVPWPDPLPTDESLHEVMVRLLGGPLPWLEEKTSA